MEAVARRAYDALDRLGDRSLGHPDTPGEHAILRAREFIRTPRGSLRTLSLRCTRNDKRPGR